MPSLPSVREYRRIEFDTQARSPLFSSLPTELRLQVYDLVLNCSRIHLGFFEGRDGPHIELGGNIVGVTPPEAILASRLLSLLLSCARAHAEALPLLYSLNTFCVVDTDVFRVLAYGVGAPFLTRLEVYLCRSYRPPLLPPWKSPTRWDSWLGKKHRRERKWARYWEPIKRFQSLQYLYIELDPTDSLRREWWRGGEAIIVKPLENLLREGISGKLCLYWERPGGHEMAAEEILDRWVVERVVN
ncbi:hypothetical protein F5Y07DRAFT_302370 [Xylaria sp. FL0933]|nr:hypothetical protein F5Y07DRAFT_302370 [Xylaria sp. FL0933]